MELQWPLILFTTLLAWCAGTFSAEAYAAARGTHERSQMRGWAVSAILLVAAGVAVFMHLQHWERIFNGFGHITSGITQELIAIVVLAVIAIVYLAQIRRNDGKVSKAVAVLAIVFSVVLLCVAGHSYQMASRPAWNNILWPISLIGAACALGPATMAAIAAAKDDDAASYGKATVIGVVINAVTSLAAALSIFAAQGSLTDVGWYYDLTHPMKEIMTTGISPFSGASMPYMVVGVILVGIVGALVCALMGKKSGKWQAWGIATALCVLVGTICLRAVFYLSGVSMFMFY
jgi:DMSO reductase anchor subunit